MSAPINTPASKDRRLPIAMGFLMVIAAVACYANSLVGVFVLDDVGSILDNATLRPPWHLGSLLNPPHGGMTVSGRPVLNLTFAANYALSGTAPWSYHIVNLAVHISAGLLLFAVLRRLFERAKAPDATMAPGLIALLWLVHPLQTEAVTYIAQRAESLMALFFLFCVYCFLRALDSPRPKRWYAGCIASFLLGIGTKENMVAVLPLLFLFDALFVPGGPRAAWSRRGAFYLVMLVGGLLWVGLLVVTGGRGGQVGLGAEGTPLSYALTQPEAILTYLRLAIVPTPLVFEYGVLSAPSGLSLTLESVAVVSLLAGSLVALKKAPWIGFIGCWFFFILAPTSVVPGTTQMIVEHRMYLPLAAVLTLVVLGILRLVPGRMGTLMCLALAAGGAVLTAHRNTVYHTDVGLWQDTVQKRPANVLAHVNLGTALAKLPGHSAEAAAEYRLALKFDPNLALAHFELGNLLVDDPSTRGEAMAQFQEAVRLAPQNAEAYNNLGRALAQTPGGLPQAITEFREAIRINPQVASAHSNLGEALRSNPGGFGEAVSEFKTAIAIDPDYAEAHDGLGVTYAIHGGMSQDAIDEFQAALRLRPDFAEAHFNLGLAYARMRGTVTDAAREFSEAIRLRPTFAEAHNALGRLWIGDSTKTPDAIEEFSQALRLKPDFAEAHYNLGNVLLGMPGRLGEAILHYEAAIRIRPEFVDAHHNLAAALLRIPGREMEAKDQLRIVLQYHPNDQDVRRVLEQLGG